LGVCVFAWTVGCFAQDEEITFTITPKTLPTNSSVFITGNSEKLGGWNAGAVSLAKQLDGSWSRTLSFPAGSELEYKITRGSWSTEAVTAEGIIPKNFKLRVVSNETVRIDVANWKDAMHKIEGQITGTVRYHRQMVGEAIRPRDVVVWLPRSYESSPEKRYPVLYVHDGQNAFDPATSFLGVDWQIDETADRLIREGKLQEIVVVGIWNTEDRREEYSETTKGHAYMRFIVEKLKPFIDQEYRTQAEREHTAVMGSSMGGLISFLLAWNYPQVFSQAECLSPAFVYRDVDATKIVESFDGTDKRIRIYMDNGGIGLEAQLQPGCEKMLRVLQAKGFQLGKNLEWFQDPAAEHSERAWSQRVWRPLLFMFGTR
jgi:predicted alpha/beta superfamily hydrolase